MLPAGQMGGMVSENQWAEELPHNADEPGKADLTANYNHPFLPPPDYLTPVSLFLEAKNLAYIHHSEQIPSNHSTEILSPPPDSVS